MHGLSAESVLAVELVTADGALIRADRTQNTDLFWALRGGGGGLGVVVALEIALFEVDDLVAGMMIWPWERAAEVLTRYVEWAETAPNSVSASGRMLQIPPAPEIPESIRGRQLVVIDGAVLGTEAEADEILAPLRALGPEIDTFGAAPLDSLIRLHMDPEPPMPVKGDGVMVDALDADAIEAMVEIAGPGTDSPLIIVELRQLGGALRVRKPGAGVLGSLDGSFAFFAAGVPMGPEVAAAIELRIDALKEALAPWSQGKPYLNFAEKRVAIGDAVGAESFARLEAVKAAIDPEGRFRSGHALAPAGAVDDRPGRVAPRKGREACHRRGGRLRLRDTHTRRAAGGRRATLGSPRLAAHRPYSGGRSDTRTLAAASTRRAATSSVRLHAAAPAANAAATSAILIPSVAPYAVSIRSDGAGM